jgi:uncharacterized protein (TIGR02270 family)
MSVASPLILQDILEQHLEEASILITRRMLSVRSPLHTLVTLTQLDRRIDAHLDGLGVDPESAWVLGESLLKFGDAGEVFVGAQLALASDDPGRFERMLELVCATWETAPGLMTALAWVPYARIAPAVPPMLTHAAAEHRAIAVAAHAAHRINGGWIEQALYDDSPLVRARACRAVGELGRADLIAPLRTQFYADDASVALWSCWSAAVLGDVEAVTALKRYVDTPEFYEHALDVVLRRLGVGGAAWLQELAQDERNVRAVVQGAAVVGDPEFVPGLIDMMHIPAFARIAAESFCTITGANLADDKLDTAPPAVENENDAPVDDPDDLLSWPDPERVSAWWSQHQARFKPGRRYLLGKPVTSEHLEWVLRHGNQKLRHGAAVELAMLRTGTSVFETRAPALRQKQFLGLA